MSLVPSFVKSGELFQNMTYADWTMEWVRWLLSANPIYGGDRDEMLMTRGNISYDYETSSGQRTITEKFLNKARTKDEIVFKGEYIFSDTPIYVIAIGAMYFVNEVDDFSGKVLEDIKDCRQACLRDINEGDRNGHKWFRIFTGGNEYDFSANLVLVQTPGFEVSISERNPFREHFEYPLQPGLYDAVAVAYCTILTGLPGAAEYRAQFGGIGRGTYMTDSVYDIVVSNSPITARSGRSFTPPIYKNLEKSP